MSRPRDYAYEALAEVTGTDLSAGRGTLNAALKSIREQMPEAPSMTVADEIHKRAKLYRQLMPEVVLTPTALAKHWKRVFEESERKTGTNLNSGLGCETCGNDKFVLVGTREGHEEYAPCPDCNPANASFFRYDGTRSVPPDPGTVRELMNR